MSGEDLRAQYAPAEQAAHNAQLAAAGQVAEDLHHQEVMASHPGRPSPAEMVDRGAIRPSGG